MLRSGPVHENTPAAVDRGDGSHGIGWIHDHLQPHAATLEGSVPADAVGHCASKKKAIDAKKICARRRPNDPVAFVLQSRFHDLN